MSLLVMGQTLILQSAIIEKLIDLPNINSLIIYTEFKWPLCVDVPLSNHSLKRQQFWEIMMVTQVNNMLKRCGMKILVLNSKHAQIITKVV